MVNFDASFSMSSLVKPLGEKVQELNNPEAEATKQDSVFLKVEDNGNGVIDADDIDASACKGKNVTGFARQILNQIVSLLTENEGENWTTGLKFRVSNLVKAFNEEVNKPSAVDEFEQAKQENLKNQKEFSDEVNKDRASFKKDSVLEILNELKKEGFNGHLKIDGYGVIEYDREQGCFVEIVNGETKPLSEEELNKKIDEIASSDTTFSCVSKYKKVQMGL